MLMVGAATADAGDRDARKTSERIITLRARMMTHEFFHKNAFCIRATFNTEMTFSVNAVFLQKRSGIT
jgi:hypothetical protein